MAAMARPREPTPDQRTPDQAPEQRTPARVRELATTKAPPTPDQRTPDQARAVAVATQVPTQERAPAAETEVEATVRVLLPALQIAAQGFVARSFRVTPHGSTPTAL